MGKMSRDDTSSARGDSIYLAYSRARQSGSVSIRIPANSLRCSRYAPPRNIPQQQRLLEERVYYIGHVAHVLIQGRRHGHHGRHSVLDGG